MRPIEVGVISDTHGLVRPEALAALRGADLIVHAGDVGAPDVLTRLATLAPVTAVRGNNDHGSWAEALPETELVEVGEARLLVVHDLGRLDLDPRAAGVHAVICGHSHVPQAAVRDSVLYLNPGSAGPRRFRLPVAVARLTVDGSRLAARIVTLEPGA
ncbi:MAG TPA: metallophosphoesterase family protein [Candidatus Binatia bacterium]|nr:metallophosphoesterase family protein [Candidatus Binatia bacterium]